MQAPVVQVPAPVSPQVETPPQIQDAGTEEWTYDPNEPRYCVCNQVSYGDMVACDNEDVSILFINLTVTSNISAYFFVI